MSLLLKLFVLAGILYEANGECPKGFSEFNNSCYAFVSHKLSWFNAASTCTAMGGYLVEIYSQADNDFIKKLLNENGDHPIWIGGEDLLKEGDWTWARSRSSMDFTDWAQDQPKADLPSSTTPHNCMEMNVVSSGGSWNDEKCEDLHRFVCQRPTASVFLRR